MRIVNLQYKIVLILLVVTLGLTACTTPKTTATPQLTEIAAPEPSPTEGGAPQPTEPAGQFPNAVEYSLGEVTITQDRFPADNVFREMPVRLNGLIAVPAGEGPFPLVVILHGNHHGCPVDASGVDRWPCDPQAEQPNYRGFDYLVSGLADKGYVALSLNINAENTLGFGEGTPGERLPQIFDLHMKALASAVAGGENGFGVNLKGKVDLTRIVLIGHSRGGEESVRLARFLQQESLSGADLLYGPVSGLVLVAAAITTVEPEDGLPVPTAILLSACDGDVVTQDGQQYFEAARLSPQQTQWINSVWLERANHNYFNRLLPADPFAPTNRPDCETLLEPGVQSGFLLDFVTDFLTRVWSQNPDEARAAAERLGIEVQYPVVNELYGLPARVALLAEATDRQVLFIPASEGELGVNQVGGTITETGITTHFCPAGYYTPEMLPGSEPCRRATVTIPGQPALAVVSWGQPGAEWRFALPEGKGDLSGYTTLVLRAAVDPLSPLNPAGEPQTFSVQLTDRAGNSATAQTKNGEPALAFPPGNAEEDAFFGHLFTGTVPLTDVRWQLSEFAGIDLSDIAQITLLFDQTPSGALFVADLQWVRPALP